MADDVAPRELTPPPIQAPTAKEKKYDRQLRLWAASGQRALEESHVLLVVGESSEGSNSSVAGAETLKNLILPGIGNFTVADAAIVTEADLGINFFLEVASLGKSRAEETARLLGELNPDVSGNAISSRLAEWLPKENSLKPYNLILACAPIEMSVLSRLSAYALEQSIPLVYMQSSSFYSSFSVQLPSEFPIVDTHPDPETTQDLRLLAPWSELSAAASAATANLESMPDHEHGHIPYIFLLLHYIDVWKESHNGQVPSDFNSKKAFQKFVLSKARTSNAEGGEENFDEACAAVLKTVAPPSTESGCTAMFDLPSCKNLTPKSANFWIIANAIKQFYTKHSVLPLPGSLPDMKATSSSYISLQNIYKSKARTDVAEVTGTVRLLEKQLNRTATAPIPDSEIEQFCKNAAHVSVLTNVDLQPLPSLRLASSSQQHSSTISTISTILENDFAPDEPSYASRLPIFLALNASLLPPATFTSLSENHESVMKAVEEVSRAKGGELHNISSVTGGIVAQEAIKLLTRQYVPVDGTVVYDGIWGRMEVLKI